MNRWECFHVEGPEETVLYIQRLRDELAAAHKGNVVLKGKLNRARFWGQLGWLAFLGSSGACVGLLAFILSGGCA